MNDIFEVLWPITKKIKKVGNARICAAVVYKGKIISVGINQRKTHPLQKKYGRNEDSIYLHAEVNAVINAIRFLSKEQLSKSTLYVLRRKTDKSEPKVKMDITGLSKPCEGCMEMIKHYGVRKVVFTKDCFMEGEINL